MSNFLIPRADNSDIVFLPVFLCRRRVRPSPISVPQRGWSASDLGFTRDRLVKCASRVNPTCGGARALAKRPWRILRSIRRTPCEGMRAPCDRCARLLALHRGISTPRFKITEAPGSGVTSPRAQATASCPAIANVSRRRPSGGQNAASINAPERAGISFAKVFLANVVARPHEASRCSLPLARG